MINDNLRQQWHVKSITSNLLVLFDRPLAFFTNNIIYINRPNNYKTRLGVVCTIFCFLKITSFHSPHNNFETLPLPSKFRGKNDKKSRLKYSIHCCFPAYFPASFLSRFLSGKLTQAHTSGFQHQTKIYRTCAKKMPLYLHLHLLLLLDLHLLLLRW